MKKIPTSSRVFALVSTLAAMSAAPLVASEDPPSEEAIHELLQITNVRGILDQMIGQIEGQMDQVMDVYLQGEELTPSQQDILARMRSRVVEVITEELAWSRMEQLYTRIYQETFSGREIEGMLAFYRTPVGQATVRKVPMVMQKAMEHMQGRMGPMMEKLQKVQEEFVEEIKADSLRRQLLEEESAPATDAGA